MRDWAIRFEIFCEPEWLALRFRKCARRNRRRSTRQPRTHRKGGAPQRGLTAKASRRGRIPSPDVGVPILSLSALAAVLGTTGKEMKNFLFYSAYWVSSKARKKVVLEPWAHLNRSPRRAARERCIFTQAPPPRPAQPREKVLF